MWLKFVGACILAFPILSEAASSPQNSDRKKIPHVSATVTASAHLEFQTATAHPDGAFRDVFEPENDGGNYPKEKPTEEDLLFLAPTAIRGPKEDAMPTPSVQPLVNARQYRGPYHIETTKYPYTSVVRTYMTSATYDHTDEEGRTTKSYVLSATYTYAKPWTTTVYSAPCNTCDYTDPNGRFTLTRRKSWVNTRYPTWRDPDKERTPKYKPWKESRTDVPYITPRPHRTRKYIEATTRPTEAFLTTATRYGVYVSAPSRNKPKWRTTTLSWKVTYTKYPSTYSESEINNVILRAIATPTPNPTSHPYNFTINGNDTERRDPDIIDSGLLVARGPAKTTCSATIDSRTFTKGQVVTTKHDTTHVIDTYEYTDSKGRVTSQKTTTQVRSYKYTRHITTTIESTYHWPKPSSSPDSTKTSHSKSSHTKAPRLKHAINPLPEGKSPSPPYETCEFHLDPTDMASLVARHKTRMHKSTSTSKYVTTWHWLPPGATKTFWFTIPEPTSKQTGTKTSITTWYWTTWLEPVTKPTSHGWWTWKESSTFTTWWWTAPPSHPITKHYADQVEETRAHRPMTTPNGSPIVTRTLPSTTMTHNPARGIPTHSNSVPTNTEVSKVARDMQTKSANGDKSILITAPVKTYTYTDIVRSITETITFPRSILTFWPPSDLPKSVTDSPVDDIYPRASSDSNDGEVVPRGTKSSLKAGDRPGMTTQTRYFGGYTSTLSWWPSRLDTTWTITRQPPPTETPEAVKRHMADDNALFSSKKPHLHSSNSYLPPLSTVIPIDQDQDLFKSSLPPYTWAAPDAPLGRHRRPSPTVWNWGTATTTELPWWLRYSTLPWALTWVAGRVPQPRTHFATTSTVYKPVTEWATRTIAVDAYSTPDTFVPLKARAAAERSKRLRKPSAAPTRSKSPPPCWLDEQPRRGDPKMKTTTMTYNVIRTTFHSRIPFSWTTTTWTFLRPTASTQKWPNVPRPTPPPGYNYWSNTPPSTKIRTSAWDPSTETDDYDFLVARALKTSQMRHATTRKHRVFTATNGPYVMTIESALDSPNYAALPSSTFTETIPYIPWDRKRPTSEPWPRKNKPEVNTWPKFTTITRTVPADLPLFPTSTWTTTITPRRHGISISGWSAYERRPEISSTRLTKMKTVVDTTVRATKTVTWLNITRSWRRPQRTRINHGLRGREQHTSSELKTSERIKTIAAESIVTIQTSNSIPTFQNPEIRYENIVPLGREPFIVEDLPAPTPTTSWQRSPINQTYGRVLLSTAIPTAANAPLSEPTGNKVSIHGNFEGGDSALEPRENFPEAPVALPPPNLDSDTEDAGSEQEYEDQDWPEHHFLEDVIGEDGDGAWEHVENWIED